MHFVSLSCLFSFGVIVFFCLFVFMYFPNRLELLIKILMSIFTFRVQDSRNAVQGKLANKVVSEQVYGAFSFKFLKQNLSQISVIQFRKSVNYALFALYNKAFYFCSMPTIQFRTSVNYSVFALYNKAAYFCSMPTNIRKGAYASQKICKIQGINFHK